MSNAVSPRFAEYLEKEFGWDAAELGAYLSAACRPLKKTLRVNTNKVSVADFRRLTEAKGWSFSVVVGAAPNVLAVDREDTSVPLGLTPEHLLGLFYIQESSASSSPWILSGRGTEKERGEILDMSASPGGKTTQLAELFPDAFVVANDPSRDRLPQLFENLERMQCPNVGVTNYDARFFGRFPESFSRVLLDAPCSGEGTAYKATGALQHWHIKNAKSIAKLQLQLLLAASQACKAGGSIAYSTCTLNRVENEGVVASALERCPYLSARDAGGENGFFRRWPHRDNAGGFFASLLAKTEPSGREPEPARDQPSTIKPLPARRRDEVLRFFSERFGKDLSGFHFYGRGDEVCLVSRDISALLSKFFFYRVGLEIGEFAEGGFVPNYASGVYFDFAKSAVEVSPADMAAYLRGGTVPAPKSATPGYVALRCGGLRLGLGLWDGESVENLFPRKLLHV